MCNLSNGTSKMQYHIPSRLQRVKCVNSQYFHYFYFNVKAGNENNKKLINSFNLRRFKSKLKHIAYISQRRHQDFLRGGRLKAEDENNSNEIILI